MARAAHPKQFGDSHFIYKRDYWTRSYKYYAWVTNAPPGVVSISGYDRRCVTCEDACGDVGCAYYRDGSTNQAMEAPLWGGDLTGLFYPVGTDGGPKLGGSITSSPMLSECPSCSYSRAFARGSGGQLMELAHWVNQWSDEGGSLRSAPTCHEDDCFYASGASNRLYHAATDFHPTRHTGLGIDVLSP